MQGPKNEGCHFRFAAIRSDPARQSCATILRDKGSFTTEQAESLAGTMASTFHGDLTTKGDLRETELSLESKIAEAKLDIIKRMFGTIGFQTVVMVGAIVALAHVAR